MKNDTSVAHGSINGPIDSSQQRQLSQSTSIPQSQQYTTSYSTLPSTSLGPQTSRPNFQQFPPAPTQRALPVTAGLNHSAPTYSQHPSHLTESQSDIGSSTSYGMEQQFQDVQDSAPERQLAIQQFSNRLKVLSLGLVPLQFLLMFTAWWWTSFLVFMFFGCITVFYRASNNNRHTSVLFLISLLLCNELRSFAVIIFYLVRVVHISVFEVVILVIAGLDALAAGPLCIYSAWWLHKSIQIDFYFLSQTFDDEEVDDQESTSV